jgi:serine/threonine protein kinase
VASKSDGTRSASSKHMVAYAYEKSLVAKRYRLGVRLGSGGMADVFEAEQVSLGRPVALKLFHAWLASDKRFVARFRREAELVGRICHPNACSLFDYGVLDDGRPFLAMERLSGSTLAKRQADATIDLTRTVDVVMQVLAALDAAHELGVVHRDVKPSNVFVSEHGSFGVTAKLIDFGIAKDAISDALTKTGDVVGTVHYLSPEQVGGEELDGRVDLYACGVILYEAFTGWLPFMGGSVSQLLESIVKGAAPRPSELCPDLSPKVEHLLVKAIAADRDARYACAAEMYEDLLVIRRQLRS